MSNARRQNLWRWLIDSSPTSTGRDDPLITRVKTGADQTYRADIDGLRALAVGLVVVFHAGHSYMPGGFVGVDVFFVISGYLITGIILSKLNQGRFSYLEFFGRRVRRIGPALVIVLLSSLVMGFFTLPWPDFHELGREAIAASAFSANILFWLQAGYFDGVADSKPLLHLWSLGVEEQFYLIWPALMMVAVMLGARWWAIVLSIVGISFIANVALIGIYPDATFYLLPSRLWELGLGGALAFHHGPRNSPVIPLRANLKAWLGLGLITASAWFIDMDCVFPGWLAVLPTIGAALVIDAGTGAWANRYVLSSPPFRSVGLISYPIYLWHWPLLALAPSPFHWGLAAKAGIIALTLFLSYLTYRYVEVPIRFGQKTGWRSTAVVVSAIFASMVLVAGLGQFVPIWLRYAHNLPDWAVKDYGAEDGPAWRANLCFLGFAGTAAHFAPECDGGGRSAAVGARPLVMLWGDSFAAHLYQGVLAQQQQRGGQDFQLSQFTASMCPPIFGISVEGRKSCAGVVDTIEGKIGQIRPDVIILAAIWDAYSGRSNFRMSSITETVTRLHALGVKSVIVVGPMPTWYLPLPQALLQEIIPNVGVPPEYSHKYLSAGAFKSEAAIRGAVIAGGGHYVSPREALCDDFRGCLVTVATTHGPEPIASGSGHLTKAGSIAFIDRIWISQIAPNLSPITFPSAIATPGE